MKSDGFDARRLRSRGSATWRWRFLAGCGAVFAGLGILLLMAGAATLLGRPSALGPLNESVGAAISVLVAGILLLWAGVYVWRRCRRRMRRSDDLSLSPGLLKKRG